MGQVDFLIDAMIILRSANRERHFARRDSALSTRDKVQFEMRIRRIHVVFHLAYAPWSTPFSRAADDLYATEPTCPYGCMAQQR